MWAVRDRAGMPVGGPTGVFSLDQDLHEWFSQDDKGMGGRICKDLQPNVQVRIIGWIARDGTTRRDMADSLWKGCRVGSRIWRLSGWH